MELQTRCTHCHQKIGTASECIRHCIRCHTGKQISILVPRDGHLYMTKKFTNVNGEPLLGKTLIDKGLEIDEVYVDQNWNLMLPTNEACHSPPRKCVKIDLPSRKRLYFACCSHIYS